MNVSASCGHANVGAIFVRQSMRSELIPELLEKIGLSKERTSKVIEIATVSCGVNLKVDEIKMLIEVIARSLVDLPQAVDVQAVVGEQTTVIKLRVDKSDIGKVIGKQGRTAQSIRTILSAASAKIKIRVVLEIIE